MTRSEDTFGRVVSLGVHDLRTPLATLAGFARTLQRVDLGEPQDRYVEIMVTAADQLTEILDDLGVAARIESDRWDPNLQERDTADLARAAAAELEGATVTGTGAPVRVDEDVAVRAVYNLARCALRHGGLDSITIEADGAAIVVTPVNESSAPVLALESLKDLGAATATRVVSALGGSVEVTDDRLLIRFAPA